MGLIKNILDSRVVQNAIQQKKDSNGYMDTLYTRNVDYNKLFFDGVNKAGKYDNLYGDSNRITSIASKYPIYYVDKNNNVIEDTDFVRYLKKPNEDYPQAKVLQQIYTEMITYGHSDLFFWRKYGKNETKIFENGKKYKEDDFRGITLVSGYDQIKLSKSEKDNIIRINYGASQSNVFMGYSPSQAATAWVKMQDEMGLHMTAFARNAGMPIGQWLITASSPEEFVKIRDKLEAKTAGARNNGKVLYSYVPTDAKQPQLHWQEFTSKEVQDYTDQLNFSDKKITQSFGVPGTIKGTNDGENYATARVSEQVFIKYTVKILIEDLKTQLEHKLSQRFELAGELKVNIPIPEIADESLVKIRATTQQVALFDKKISEGYTPESIVLAYDLPQSFLLLEKYDNTNNSNNTVKKAMNKPKVCNHIHNERDEFERQYQNALTEEERNNIETKFREATKEYSDYILKNGIDDISREEYKGKMTVIFTDQYAKLYDKSVDDVAEALLNILEVIDIADLELTEAELEEAVKQYNIRVDDFSKSFAEDVAKLPGKTLKVRQKNAEPNIKRVVVSESEHTRIVSELKAWTKAEEDFPVRVYKTWHTKPGACPDCLELEDTEIDVTALFVGRNDISFDEIYEVQGGGLHPNCRCYLTYEMDKA